MYPILRDTQNTSMPQSISTDWRTRKGVQASACLAARRRKQVVWEGSRYGSRREMEGDGLSVGGMADDG